MSCKSRVMLEKTSMVWVLSGVQVIKFRLRKVLNRQPLINRLQWKLPITAVIWSLCNNNWWRNRRPSRLKIYITQYPIAHWLGLSCAPQVLPTGWIGASLYLLDESLSKIFPVHINLLIYLINIDLLQFWAYSVWVEVMMGQFVGFPKVKQSSWLKWIWLCRYFINRCNFSPGGCPFLLH